MQLILEVIPEEYDWIKDQNEAKLSLNSDIEYYGARITVNEDAYKIYQLRKLREKLKNKLRNKLKDYYGTTSTTLTIQKIDQWLKDMMVLNQAPEE